MGMYVTPGGPRDPQPPDFLDLANATREADRLSTKLILMTDELADARVIIEFDSERRRAALSKAVLAAFKAGADSTSRAEHEARASASYGVEMQELATNLAKAERSKITYEVTKIRIDVVRGMIASHRAMIEMK